MKLNLTPKPFANQHQAVVLGNPITVGKYAVQVDGIPTNLIANLYSDGEWFVTTAGGSKTIKGKDHLVACYTVRKGQTLVSGIWNIMQDRMLIELDPYNGSQLKVPKSNR